MEGLSELQEQREVKVLVSRTDKIGDVILTLPLINEVKRLIPNSRISFLISKKLENLIDGYKDVDKVFFVEDINLNSFLKENNFDVAISVYPRKELALAFYKAGIKYRVGTAYRLYSVLFNHRIKEHRKYAEKHEADYNLNLLSFLGKEISFDKKFFFKYSDEEMNVLQDKLHFKLNEKCVVIHPGSKGSARDLPIDKIMEIPEYIIRNHRDYKIVLTGIPQEKPITGLFKEIYKDKVIDLAGEISLRELLILIDKSSLFISNSTGPIHIAGALNKNIIGFYPNSAPMNATRWKPLCKNVKVISPITGDDMSTINNAVINSTISEFLNHSNI
jgi:ADP-heptose:LPS heptosyltransferase